MGISQKDLIHSLSNLLNWLEQENSWGTNKGELRFITGRLGELYVAIMTNGQMAEATNQAGYDVVSEENERISVKTTTNWIGTHNFTFNKNTLAKVDRITLVYVDVEEVSLKIIFDEPKEKAVSLMVDADNGSKYSFAMSKIITKQNELMKSPTIIAFAKYKDYTINRLESGTIELLQSDIVIKPVKPILRKIAKEIGVDINNSTSNPKNTRVLGWDIIKQLSL